MLSTIDLVVAGLSSGHKIGLAAVGAAFIVFALVSAFVLPRRSPNFPGRGLGWYVVVCVLFFVAMLSAVLVFGREAKEAGAEQQTSTTATTTSGSSSGGGSGGGGGSSAKVVGDPAAGKAVFESAGCTGCHTLKAAGSHGTIGPNLDQLKPAEAVVKNQVIHGGGPMPAFAGRLSAKQIQDVAAFVYTATHS
jgi:cytochrome c6